MDFTRMLGKNQEISKHLEKKYLRVTDILYPFSGMKHVDEHVLENAARRGSRVHFICEAIMQSLDLCEVEEELKGYIESFNQWWDKQPIACIEKRFFCDDLCITGQIDAILKTSTGHVILDLKTSSKPQKSWPLQGSAYAYLASKYGYNVEGIQFLQLFRDGRQPTVHAYEDNFDLFRKCLDVYRHFF